MSNDFRVETRVQGRAAIVEVIGELDIATSPQLERALERAFESGADPLVIDLRKLAFMDSTGLSVIVSAHQHMSETGHSFSVVKGPQQVQRLLDLTGVSGRLRLVDSPEDVFAGG
jgi:anti-sigma B factor antagonist